MSGISEYKNKISPVIIVIAYNREDSLERLLASLQAADYGQSQVKLIISIDKSDNDQVAQVAEDFSFSHGSKEVIKRESNMGLFDHVLACSRLAEDYGAAVILEDDLLVSEDFYSYACSALEFSEGRDYIAGVSLYKHLLNVHAREPFEPVNDGYDGWYFQFASSWGQAFTAGQWRSFRTWLEKNKEKEIDRPVFIKGREYKGAVPENICSWGSKSWLKYFMRYVIENDKYFLYPQQSRTTNFAAKGTHSMGQEYDLQVPLSLGKKTDFIFPEREESLSVYDAYFENLSLKARVIGRLKDMGIKAGAEDIAIDLYGSRSRENISSYSYVLSSRAEDRRVLFSYGRLLRPHENNIFKDMQGEEFFLYEMGRPGRAPRISKYKKLSYNYRAFKAAYGLDIIRERIKTNVWNSGNHK